MNGFFCARLAIACFVLLLSGCGDGGGTPAGPGAPVIGATSPPSGTVGVAYAGYTFNVASGGTAPFIWSETGTLPPGLSLSTAGQLSGTPTTAGTYPVTITVTDSAMPPLTASKPVSLLINVAPPVIGASSPPAGTTDVVYPGYTFTVASGGLAPFTWSETGTLPPGLSLSAAGDLTGTPLLAGTYPVTVTVTDSAMPPLTDSTPVDLVINNSPIVVSTTSPPAGYLTNPYPGFMFTVASGGSAPFTWAVTSGALPDGLALGSDGSLSGTPTANGSFFFTVTATDSAPVPATGSAPFTIVISSPGAPTINSGEAPTATKGVAYPGFTFTASGGFAPLTWSATGGALPNLAVGSTGLLSGTPTSEGIFPITLHVTDALSASASAPTTVRVALPRSATVTATGSMSVARSGHAATLLPDGTVLITGGQNATGASLASAELFDKTTGLFTATTGMMTVIHTGHTATLLSTGKVLIAGGDVGGIAAELYNPATKTFAATGSMTIARRFGPTATLLNNGKVLLAGGEYATAELYDPASGMFAATGSMGAVRGGHTATLLADGRVLVTGGGPSSGPSLATAEIYDPATGMFTATTGSMAAARTAHTATLLPGGKVLVVGTQDTNPELFDSGTGTFTAVGDLSPYASVYPSGIRHTASLRGDGTVLIAGGYQAIYDKKLVNGRCVSSSLFTRSGTTTALYAPEAEGFTTTATLNTARDRHTATVLADGSVLVVGGVLHTATIRGDCAGNKQTATTLSSAEIFN